MKMYKHFDFFAPCIDANSLPSLHTRGELPITDVSFKVLSVTYKPISRRKRQVYYSRIVNF